MSSEPVGFPHEVPSTFIELARRVAPAGPVICDIGSRDALEGIFLAHRLDAAECHVFEPNPEAGEICRVNIGKYGGDRTITFNAVALSDREGTTEFFPVNAGESANKDIGFSSMFPINPAYTARRATIVQDRITVPTTTLDRYFEGRSRRADILWIDVEGAELLVLRGAEETLRGVSLIHLEVSFRPMQVGKPLFWEVDGFLKQRGFERLGFPGVAGWKAFLVTRRLLPNLPWRWNAVYGRVR